MLTILGFGASTMQGSGDSQGGFFKRAAALCQAGQLPIDFINKGNGGNRTGNMLERAAKLEAFQPYDLVLQLGCNDFPRRDDRVPENRSSQAVYVANVDRLMGAIRGRRSLFISSFLVSEEKAGVSPRLFEDYMSEAIRLAKSHRYEVFDLYAETKSTAAAYWAADGVHFNDAGHELIAQRVLPWITAGLDSPMPAPQP